MNRVDGSNLNTQLDLEGLPRHISLTAASATYSMKVSDKVLIVDTTSAGGDGVCHSRVVPPHGSGKASRSFLKVNNRLIIIKKIPMIMNAAPNPAKKLPAANWGR